MTEVKISLEIFEFQIYDSENDNKLIFALNCNRVTDQQRQVLNLSFSQKAKKGEEIPTAALIFHKL